MKARLFRAFWANCEEEEEEEAAEEEAVEETVVLLVRVAGAAAAFSRRMAFDVASLNAVRLSLTTIAARTTTLRASRAHASASACIAAILSQ